MKTVSVVLLLLWAVPSAQAWQSSTDREVIDSWLNKLKSGNRDKIKEARQEFKKHQKEKKDNDDAVIFARLNIAWCDFWLGKRAKARKELAQLIRVYPNHRMRIWVERDLGNICEIEWRSQEARKHLSQALQLAAPLVKQGIVKPVDVANIRIIHGTNFVILGEHPLAQQELEAAKTTLEKSTNQDPRARILLVNCTHQLSTLKERESRIFESIDDTREVLKQMQAIRPPTRDSVEREFSSHHGLAKFSRDLTRFRDAKIHLANAEKLLENSKTVLGEVHHDRHREELEIAMAEVQIEAVKVAFEKSGFDAALLKELEAAENTIAVAEQWHDKITKEQTKETATTLTARGAIHKLRGQLHSANGDRNQAQKEYQLALNDYSAAYKIFLDLLDDPNLDNLLEIQRDQLWLENQLGNGKKALQMARSIWRVYQTRRNQLQSAMIHQELIELEAKYGNLDEAQFHAQEHRTLANQRLLDYAKGLTAATQQTFFRRWYDPGFQAGLRVAIEQGVKSPNSKSWLEKSAQWVMNSKAKSAEVLAATSRQGRTQRDLQHIIEQQSYFLYGDVPEDIQQNRLIELESEKGALLEKQAGAVGGLPANPFTVKELKQRLKPDELLIDIVCVKDAEGQPRDYYAWLHTNAADDPVKFVHLGKASQVEPLVDRLVDRLESSQLSLGTEENLQEAARAEDELQKDILNPLSQHLLAPLWKASGTKRKWFISPDGELWNLPWAALILPNGEYAVQELTIQYVISARDFFKRTPGKAVLGPPLILARPDYNQNLYPHEGKPREGLDRMVGFQDIAERLEKVLKTQYPEVNVWRSAEASKANLLKMKESPKILYLGTHAQFLVPNDVRVDDPFLCSFIGMSGYNILPAAGEDTHALPGVLTAAEVLLANLENSELVVLAGCQTGRGIADYGHSSASLRHAFHLAGARAVVSTQWSVLNSVTNVLMFEFMRATQTPGKEKAEALRETQIKMIQNSRYPSHPVFWAAFSISGF